MATQSNNEGWGEGAWRALAKVSGPMPDKPWGVIYLDRVPWYGWVAAVAGIGALAWAALRPDNSSAYRVHTHLDEQGRTAWDLPWLLDTLQSPPILVWPSTLEGIWTTAQTTAAPTETVTLIRQLQAQGLDAYLEDGFANLPDGILRALPAGTDAGPLMPVVPRLA